MKNLYLSPSSLDSELLYKIALKKNTLLFVNWIFTFRSHIETIKNDYDSGKLGEIRSILMNRLNLGPERNDVNPQWDLASHDVSIIQYLFDKNPREVRWIDFKKNKKSILEDSSLGLVKYEDFITTIHVSWQYRKKVRECIFEFENYFVVWDDFKKFLEYKDSKNLSFPVYTGNISYPCNTYYEPLKKAINTFFSFTKEDVIKQKRLTIDTIKILEI